MSEDPKSIVPPPIQAQSVINIPINLQLIYANGVIINMSQSDIQIAFSVNGRPVIATAMTLPVAKHLQKSLAVAISNYEKKTGVIIGDLVELSEKLKNQ